MARRMRDLARGGWDELRYEPVRTRLRAFDGDRAVVDTDRGMLVWEPRRVVPSYAVPETDVAAQMAPATTPAPEPGDGFEFMPGMRVLPPGQFRAHTAPGDDLAVGLEAGMLDGAAYRLDDPDLAGHVVLDFEAFAEWREEETVSVGHPRDPYKRIDVKRSDRHVRVEHEGTVLAETHRPSVLLETWLPDRWYLPAEDVRTDLLERSETQTVCAYKGLASYWALPASDGAATDVAWYYPDPLEDGEPVKDMLCFIDGVVDVRVGERGPV